MKRVFILKGLDCPNCSAKIEKEVGALPGVESSVVNLMQQTLTVQSEKSADATLAEQVETIVHSHEPDVEVSEKTEPAVTKVYLLKGLDCPNCSAKIEKEVGELGGVASSTVNLMNQTLTVQAGTSVATSLLDTVTTIVHSHEPDVEVSEKTEPAMTKVYLLKGLDCPNCSASRMLKCRKSSWKRLHLSKRMKKRRSITMRIRSARYGLPWVLWSMQSVWH